MLVDLVHCIGVFIYVNVGVVAVEVNIGVVVVVFIDVMYFVCGLCGIVSVLIG